MKYNLLLLTEDIPPDDIIIPVLISLFICGIVAFFLLNLFFDRKYGNIVRVIQAIIILVILAVGLMIIIKI